MFNPFEKQIGQPLTAEDLQQLVACSVTEGYFVEYKSTIVAREKIAKSIASFANTGGGWYIVGVETDGHNVATKVCGFSTKMCHDPIATVREVVKSRVDPNPVMYLQVVRLTDELIALVVYIPDEQDGPFITTDGRLYVRHQDSSDPVFEKDRYALERLYDRAKDMRQRVERFCQDTRTLSKANAKQGWITLFLWPYPSGLVEMKMPGTHEWLADILTRSKQPVRIIGAPTSTGITGTLPFSTAQMTPDSVILRQVQLSEVATAGLTLEIFASGNMKLHIPLIGLPNPLHEPERWAMNKEPADTDQLVPTTSQVRNVLRKLWREAIATGNTTTFGYLRFFDFAILWQVVAGAIAHYLEVLGDQPLLPEFRMALLLSDVWRATPYVDSDVWAEHVEAFGLPVVQGDPIRHPVHAGNSIPIFNDVQRERASLWLAICNELALALGFPTDFIPRYFNEMAQGDEGIEEPPIT